MILLRPNVGGYFDYSAFSTKEIKLVITKMSFECSVDTIILVTIYIYLYDKYI